MDRAWPSSHTIEEAPLPLAPCWAPVEDLSDRVEVIVAAGSCFLDMGAVRRAMQEIIRQSGSRFDCLERILRAILRAEELMYRRDAFLFSFQLCDLEAARLYLDQERWSGLHMTYSERIERQLRRFIADPTAQADAAKLIEMRDAAIGQG